MNKILSKWVKHWDPLGVNFLLYIYKSFYKRRTKITGLCRLVAKYIYQNARLGRMATNAASFTWDLFKIFGPFKWSNNLVQTSLNLFGVTNLKLNIRNLGASGSVMVNNLDEQTFTKFILMSAPFIQPWVIHLSKKLIKWQIFVIFSIVHQTHLEK